MSVLDYVMGMKSAGSGGGSTGGGGLAVEFTEYHRGRYDVGLESDISWAEIEEAYTSGQSVVFHIPNCQSYSISECYANIIGYRPANEESGERMAIDFTQGNSQIFPPVFTNPAISEDGKLDLQFYID